MAKTIRFPFPKYSGVLAQPMNANSSSYQDEFKFKVSELYRHFGINQADKNASTILAIFLALNHVPGFQYKKKPGRKPIWKNDANASRLHKDVLKIAKKGRHSVDNACRLLSAKPKYLGMKPSSIKTRFYEIEKHNGVVSAAKYLLDNKIITLDEYLTKYPLPAKELMQRLENNFVRKRTK